MRKMFWVLAVLIVLAFTVLGGAIWVGGEIWKTALDSNDTILLSIPSGASTSAIAERLKNAELVNSTWLFNIFARFTGKASELKAGDYAIARGTGISGLFSILSDGQSRTDEQVTIPEGYTLVQIGEVMETKLGVTATDWEAETGIDSPFEGALPLLKDKPDSVDLEGYLFPDTYRFATGASAHDVVEKMLTTMADRLAEQADSIGTVENIHALLTLASIVERESPDDANRGRIAGIFQNRLDIGMALQADSTVNYVTGKKTPAISLDDTALDSPYNTYKYRGLPPGPIANPGLASILSAANPTATEEMYFLTTAEGEVLYAETYDQHLVNKARSR